MKQVKEIRYHSKLSVEQIMKNIEVFSHEWGLQESFFEPYVYFASRRIEEKPVDHREELYFVITNKGESYVQAFVGSRNYKSKKLEISVMPETNGSEVRVVSKTAPTARPYIIHT